MEAIDALEEVQEARRSTVALIGAFNDDYFVKGRVPAPVSDMLQKVGIALRPFRENAIPADVGEEVLHYVRPNLERKALGGATYHTLRGLSQYARDLDLKVIGSLSDGGDNGGHNSVLAQLSVDREWLSFVQGRSALSLCFEHDGGRTLLTTPASNSSVVELLQSRGKEIEAELIDARMIHFNSYIEDDCQKAVASLLRRVIARSADVQISFDAGSDWRAGESATLFDVISQTSILHLKEQAFNEIGGRVAGEERRTVAKRILNEMRGPLRRILVRSDGEVSLFMDSGVPKIIELQFSLGAKRSTQSQIFQTGEGHVFAGVFLASIVSKALASALATRHAMFVMGRAFDVNLDRPECQFSIATDDFLDQRTPSFGLMSTNEYCSVGDGSRAGAWGKDESGSS